MPEDITPKDLFIYLDKYIEAYKKEYHHFTSSPPRGGYPKLKISPYLNTTHLHCYLATDGVVIAEYSYEPDYQWEIAGGAALVVDFPETKCPQKVKKFLKNNGLLGKNIGLYRIVGRIQEEGIPVEVWNGKLFRHNKIFKKKRTV